MKTAYHKTSLYIFTLLIITLTLTFSSCKDDDPKKEDVPELITKVTLTFTPAAGEPIVVTATDPDGQGVQPLTLDNDIVLNPATTYVMSIALLNTIAAPTDPGYNITEEVEEEGDEHMFFFAWTNNTFSNPEGNGNFDNRNDAINYEGGSYSKDANGLPLGLQTTWQSASSGSGTFRVVLKHQPELKSATSDSGVGETDVDVTFQLSIAE